MERLAEQLFCSSTKQFNLHSKKLSKTFNITYEEFHGLSLANYAPEFPFQYLQPGGPNDTSLPRVAISIYRR